MLNTPINTILSRSPGPALHRARRLLDISLALNTLRDPGDLLLYIIETATEVLGCTAASLLLYDDTEQRLRFVAATGARAETLAEIPVPLHGSIAGTIFRENRPVVAGNAKQDQRHFQGVAERTGVQTEALLGVPMCIDGAPIGVFEVLNPKVGSFSEEDVDTLLLIASQAAVAIENVRQRRELREANERLAKLDRLKSDFMSLASHELRTPLAIILGAGDVLREEARPDLLPFAEDIREAGDRMHDLIETLEEMSFLQEEMASLVLLPVVLQDTLRDAWVKAEIDGSALHAVLDLPDTPLRVEADARRLQLAFANILKNARSFTPDGGTVRVTLRTQNGQVTIQVQDSGTGLSEADCRSVFQAFYQVEDVLTRGHEGLGIGLTIARALLRLHKGDLWATSPGLGQGSTFHVTLPLLAPASQPAS
ncbi:MAG: GAF domain-containing sensor histidine kinase [Bacteroidota bacterium]